MSAIHSEPGGSGDLIEEWALDRRGGVGVAGFGAVGGVQQTQPSRGRCG